MRPILPARNIWLHALQLFQRHDEKNFACAYENFGRQRRNFETAGKADTSENRNVKKNSARRIFLLGAACHFALRIDAA